MNKLYTLHEQSMREFLFMKAENCQSRQEQQTILFLGFNTFDLDDKAIYYKFKGEYAIGK